MYKNRIIIVSLFTLFVITLTQCGCEPVKVKGKSKGTKIPSISMYERIHIKNDVSPNGMFDPAIEYDQKGIGWLVYSGIEFPKYTHTELAKTTDNGKTWTCKKRLHTSKDGTVILKNGKQQKGVWRNEVATLLHDPRDLGKEWKMFWHKYFIKPPYKPKHRMFQFGCIAYSYAKEPEGPWSEEIPLFGAGPYPTGEQLKTAINLSDLHPDLKNFVTYSEPGVIMENGIIYLSLEGSVSITGMGKWKKHKTFLLASHDHGQTWKYVGTLTNFNDAKRLNYVLLFSSSLVRIEDNIFLFLVPTGAKGFDGTIAVEFENIHKAKLKRDKDGNLVIYKHLKPSNVIGGPGDFDEKNTNGGFVMGHINKKGMPKVFQLFNTHDGICIKAP